MGKARSFSDESEDANYQKQSDDELYSFSQQNSYNLGSVHFSDQSGIGNFSQSGSDQRKADLDGALFRGNLGFEGQNAVLDVATETIDLLSDDENNPLSISATIKLVFLSSGTTGNLLKIIGAQRPGQRLILCGIQGNVITIKDASNNIPPTAQDLIHTPSDADFTLANTDAIELIYDGSDLQWRILSSAGFPASGGYNLIKDDGEDRTPFSTMNFTGNIVTVTDGSNETVIAINAPAGTVPDGDAENQHLEWDNSDKKYNAVDFLTLGETGPFAGTGLIRTANNKLIFASRNNAGTGDIGLRINSSNKFTFEFPGSVIPLEISSNEIDVKTVDIVNIDRAIFKKDSGVAAGVAIPQIFIGTEGSENPLVINNINTSEIVFTHSNLIGLRDSSTKLQKDVKDQLARFRLFNTGKIPTTGNSIGDIIFSANSGPPTSQTDFAIISGVAADTTEEDFEGGMAFQINQKGVLADNFFMRFNDSKNNLIDMFRDVDMNTFDIQNIDRLRFKSSSNSPATNNDPSIYIDANSNMVFNVGDQLQYFWTTGNKTKMQLDQSGVNNDTILTVETDDTNASAIPQVVIFRDDPTPEKPAMGPSEITNLFFNGTHALTNGGAKTGSNVYAEILTSYESVIEGQEAGSMNFFTAFKTTGPPVSTQLKPFLGLNNDNSEEIEALVNLDLHQNRLIFDNEKKTTYMVSRGVSPGNRIDVFVNNIDTWLWAFDAINMIRFCGVGTFTTVDPGENILTVGNNSIQFIEAKAPTSSWISDKQGWVYFDESTDPGVLKIKKKNAAGTVSTVSLEAVATNTIFQLNSNITVTDSGFGSISAFIDGVEELSIGPDTVVVTGKFAAQGFADLQANVDLGNSSSNTITFAGRVDSSIIPSTDGTRSLGTSSLRWATTFTDKLDIQDDGSGNTPSSTTTTIVADTGGMNFGVPSDGDVFEFFFDATSGFLIKEDRIEFTQSNRKHEIRAESSSLQILTQATNDSIQFFTGTSRTNNTLEIKDESTIWRSTTSNTSPAILLQLIQNANTPSNGKTLGNIDFIAENTLSADTTYARISGTSQFVTAGSEKGLLQFAVASDSGSLINLKVGMQIQGDKNTTNGVKIGFFGESVVSQQTVADTATNLQIITALKNLGLFT